MNARPPVAVLPDPTGPQHAADILMSLALLEFYDVVDRDIRGNDRLGPDEHPLHQLFSDALRTEDVCERWFQALVRMKKSTEMTIAAKTLDDKTARSSLLAQAVAQEATAEARESRGETRAAREAKEKAEEARGRMSATRERHLKWRAGAIRFLTGVEERLAEANYCRRRLFGNRLPDMIRTERDRLSEYSRVLADAIRDHQDEFPDNEEPSKNDLRLWAVLSEAVALTD